MTINKCMQCIVVIAGDYRYAFPAGLVLLHPGLLKVHLFLYTCNKYMIVGVVMNWLQGS